MWQLESASCPQKRLATKLKDADSTEEVQILLNSGTNVVQIPLPCVGKLEACQLSPHMGLSAAWISGFFGTGHTLSLAGSKSGRPRSAESLARE